MDLFSQKRFVLIKDIVTQEGVIPNGSEVTLFRGFIYLNGGMITPSYNKIFLDILNDETQRDLYFREVKILHNKL